jgi:hypothetical protein
MPDWDVIVITKVRVSGAYASTKEIAEQTAISLLDMAGWTPEALQQASDSFSDFVTQTELLDMDIEAQSRWIS